MSDKYDLSYDKVEYSIADFYINQRGKNNFSNNIYNNLSNSISNNFNKFLSLFSSNSSNFNRPNIYAPSYDIRLDRMNGTDFESYNKKYDDDYRLDGYLLYKDHVYNDIKDELEQRNPNISEYSNFDYGYMHGPLGFTWGINWAKW